MEKKYCRGHIGKTFITNQGYNATVIDGGTKNKYCTIQIEDYVDEVHSVQVMNGALNYPFHRSVQGKGYVGTGKYSSKGNRRVYGIWKGILERCYDPKSHEKRPTYIGASVCEEWLNFQNFAKWFEENYVEGFEIDKDLLIEGNKLYSLDTCVFIPTKLNSFLANIKASNTSGNVGVTQRPNRTTWEANIKINGKTTYLGSFTTIEEASEVYQEARRLEANKLKELYKGILPDSILNKIR